MRSDLVDLFWAKVDKTDDCWNWTAATTKGYGSFGRGHGTKIAHRISYELLVGKIPDGLHIDHLCDNKLCVNPEHLEPVTLAENTQRHFKSLTHCKRGHERTEENTILKRNKADISPSNPTGECRQCRKCLAIHAHRKYVKKRDKYLRLELLKRIEGELPKEHDQKLPHNPTDEERCRFYRDGGYNFVLHQTKAIINAIRESI